MKRKKRNVLEACRWSAQAVKDLTGQETALSAEQYAFLLKRDLLDVDNVSIILGRDLKTGGRLFGEFEFLENLGKTSSAVEWEKVKSSFNVRIVEEIPANEKKYALNKFRYETNDYGNH